MIYDPITLSAESPVKVYLAGKIARLDWRHSIVPDLQHALFNEPIAIHPGLVYVGPYFLNAGGHGITHGPATHGCSEIGCYGKGYADSVHGQVYLYEHGVSRISYYCLRAIDRADVVFAYIDRLDCYGTMAELGYASALGKQIFIAYPKAFIKQIPVNKGTGNSELWFIESLASDIVECDAAEDGFNQVFQKPGEKPKHFPSQIFDAVSSEEFFFSRAWRELRYQTLLKHGKKCQCCGATPPKAILHVDHIKPRSKYPHLALDPGNLQVLCKDCNFGKSNKDETDHRGW